MVVKMEVPSLEEYIAFYESTGCKRLWGEQYVRSNRLTNKQLESHYKKFLEKAEKSEIKQKDRKDKAEWDALKATLPKDCELLMLLYHLKQYELVEELKENAGSKLNVIDMAHIFPRGGYPWLCYDPDNVVSLNRYSHGNIDYLKDPIDGSPITKEEQERWWRVIVGNERYDRLLKKARRGVVEEPLRPVED